MSLFQYSLNDVVTLVTSRLTDLAMPIVYMGIVPDFLIRLGIRYRLQDTLITLRAKDAEDEMEAKMKTIEALKTNPTIAIATDEANDQHYEVPAEFYDLCLGPRKKYSSGYWPSRKTTFEESEEIMLDMYCKRAGVKDGMKIVDIGCGWGSLTLYLCEKFPNAKITSISNSNSQREFIYADAKRRGLNWQNINIVTCNISDDKGALDVVKDNDLAMTIEMFEHMKNYSMLLKKVYGFLKPKGKLFVHIFTHKDFTYNFEDGWMADNFFTGGTMPSDDMLLYFCQDFSIMNHWRVNGTHYEKTSNGWLDYLDKNWKNGKLQPVLAKAYGEGKEKFWYINWRLFFLACAELWGYKRGQEWIVSHYLFERK
ncbi:unnamed protein product [Cylindrotheca closterium]|uniref:Uncharacterized protein n=1 Tax=Cylindrotheca closterium TaxID=2856 RepID=A0AAD2CPW4_9STRA|nr:unnamed protein product [Cylindrotheca closterium]